MTPELFASILTGVKDLTLTASLVFILVGGYKGWWIWGSLHREIVAECRKDRDEWKARSVKNDTLLEWAASIAEAETRRDRRP